MSCQDHGYEAVLRGARAEAFTNTSVVILQNPIGEQGDTSFERLWKGTTDSERLRTTTLDQSTCRPAFPLLRGKKMKKL